MKESYGAFKLPRMKYPSQQLHPVRQAEPRRAIVYPAWWG